MSNQEIERRACEIAHAKGFIRCKPHFFRPPYREGSLVDTCVKQAKAEGR
jgi:hypothetical protein